MMDPESPSKDEKKPGASSEAQHDSHPESLEPLWAKTINDCEKRMLMSLVYAYRAIYNHFLEIGDLASIALDVNTILCLELTSDSVESVQEDLLQWQTRVIYFNNAQGSLNKLFGIVAAFKDRVEEAHKNVEEKIWKLESSGYLQAEIQQTFMEELDRLDKSKKDMEAKFQSYCGQIKIQEDKLRELSFEIVYHEYSTKGFSIPATISDPESCKAVYETIVTEAQKTIIKTLLDQYNQIYAGFKEIMEQAWKMSDDKNQELFSADWKATQISKTHERFNDIASNIATDIETIIEELTQATKSLLIDIDIAEQFIHRSRTAATNEKWIADLPQVLKSLELFKSSKRADFKITLVRIQGERVKIDHFMREIKRVQDAEKPDGWEKAEKAF